MPPRKRVERSLSDDDDLDRQYSSSEEDSNENRKESKRRGRPRKKPKQEDSEEEFFHKLSKEVEDDEDGTSDIETSPKTARTNFEAGQIVRIYVENFMCHRKFTINLGQGLNFICGKNGSG
jgi:structural maintenance of chromosomes protein 6